MGNPNEYVEIMQAAFAFGTTDTVDQVIARHKASHDAEEARRRAEMDRLSRFRGSKPRPGQAAPSRPPAPPQADINRELTKVQDLIKANRERMAANQQPAE